MSGTTGGEVNNGTERMVPQVKRNSLGDLKIPARISQAQVGLRRDLGMAREFVANIEQPRSYKRHIVESCIRYSQSSTSKFISMPSSSSVTNKNRRQLVFRQQLLSLLLLHLQLLLHWLILLQQIKFQPRNCLRLASLVGC